MKATILILLAVLIVSVFLMISLFKKRKTQEKVSHYVCDTCGELDCICHKVNDKPNK
jgi:uncharacterized protein YoxC